MAFREEGYAQQLGRSPKLNLEAVPEGQRPSAHQTAKPWRLLDLSSLIFTSHLS